MYKRQVQTRVRLNLRACCCVLAVAALHACALSGAGQDKGDDNPLNATYVIGTESITLVNGFADRPAAPGSSARVTTEVWGSPEFADLDADGHQDAVLILIHSTGGSGTFYYVATAAFHEQGYRGTAGVFLGDRINVQGVGIDENRITVKFLGRNPSDAFSTPPSKPMEQLVIYDSGSNQLIEVAREFEGEANPAHMTLPMKTWYWVKTSYNDGRVHTPTTPGAFSLTFQPEGKLSVTTDCNTMRGGYRAVNNTLHFENMMSTRMHCEDSQEQLFANMLQSVSSYLFTSHGKLILELQADSGAMIFQ